MSDTAPAAEHDPSHASDHAYRLIRAQILSGERAGGDWLREGDLAESIGVSRTPVREALRRLTAEGLVRHERNRGVQVAAWTRRGPRRDLQPPLRARAVGLPPGRDVRGGGP